LTRDELPAPVATDVDMHEPNSSLARDAVVRTLQVIDSRDDRDVALARYAQVLAFDELGTDLRD
jgi:hypothetical protein